MMGIEERNVGYLHKGTTRPPTLFILPWYFLPPWRLKNNLDCGIKNSFDILNKQT